MATDTVSTPWRFPLKLEPALLCLSRQIYAEAKPILYQTNQFFYFSTLSSQGKLMFTMSDMKSPPPLQYMSNVALLHMGGIGRDGDVPTLKAALDFMFIQKCRFKTFNLEIAVLSDTEEQAASKLGRGLACISISKMIGITISAVDADDTTSGLNRLAADIAKEKDWSCDLESVIVGSESQKRLAKKTWVLKPRVETPKVGV